MPKWRLKKTKESLTNKIRKLSFKKKELFYFTK